MNLGDIIVRGGLQGQEWERQKEERDVRALGYKERGLRVQQIASETGLQPLRHQVAEGELEGQVRGNRHRERLRPYTQATELFEAQTNAQLAPVQNQTRTNQAQLDLGQSREALRQQPNQHVLQRLEQELAMTEAAWKKLNQEMDQRGRSAQLRLDAHKNEQAMNSLKLQQTGLLYQMYRAGGPKAVLKAINENEYVFGDTKYKDIQERSVMMPDGTSSNVLVLIDDKGNESSIKIEALEQLAQQYGSSYEKVGDTLVRISPTGVQPVYQQDTFDVNTETGALYSKRSGAQQAVEGLPGQPGTGYRVTKNDKELDARVKMAINGPLMHRYGGRFEGGVWFPDEGNKDNALKAAVRAEELIRAGGNPVASAEQAINEVEKAANIDAVAGSQPTGQRPFGGAGDPSSYLRNFTNR